LLRSSQKASRTRHGLASLTCNASRASETYVGTFVISNVALRMHDE